MSTASQTKPRRTLRKDDAPKAMAHNCPTSRCKSQLSLDEACADLPERGRSGVDPESSWGRSTLGLG